jgi:hypothetical protein
MNAIPMFCSFFDTTSPSQQARNCMWLSLVLVFVALLVLRGVFLVLRRDVVSFDRVSEWRVGPPRDPFYTSLGFLQENVLVISTPDDIAAFAKTQQNNNRVAAFKAVLGCGWYLHLFFIYSLF